MDVPPILTDAMMLDESGTDDASLQRQASIDLNSRPYSSIARDSPNFVDMSESHRLVNSVNHEVTSAAALRALGTRPHMARVQTVLQQDLKMRIEFAERELRAAVGAAAASSRAREDAGVALYGAQAQLATLAAALAAESATGDRATRERNGHEAAAREATTAAAAAEATADAEESAMLVARADADALAAALRHAEVAGTADIAASNVLRRQALRGGQALVDAEAAKARQDTVLDRLGTRIRATEAEIAIYGAQIEALRGEAPQGSSASDAQVEELRADMVSLLSQWRSTLAELRRRDAATAVIERARGDVATAGDALLAEEGNVSKAMRDAVEELAAARERLSREAHAQRTTEVGIAASAATLAMLEVRQEELSGALLVSTTTTTTIRAEGRRIGRRAAETLRARRIVNAQGAEAGA